MASQLSAAELAQSKAGGVTATVAVCTGLASITVVLRLYGRWGILGKVFLDDYLIVAGLIGSIGLAIAMGIQIAYGFGRHIATVSAADLMAQRQAGVAGIFFFHWCHMTVKTSILLQYLRICVVSLEKRICYAIMCYIIACGVAWIVTLFFTCIPFEALWVSGLSGVRCIDNTVSFYAASVTVISADFAILLFPVLPLRHSLLPLRRKIALGVVLGLGGLACVATILRVRYIYASTTSTDSTWDKVPNSILGDIEINLGIICSSIATLQPLINRYLPGRWLGGWTDSKKAKNRQLGRLTITGGTDLDTKSGSWSASGTESESSAPSKVPTRPEVHVTPDVELGIRSP